MIDRRFYGTNTLVDRQVENLKEIEVLDGGWTRKYLDQEGNQWLQYNVDPDRGYHYNLMRITPMLNTNDLIQIALASEYDDEVSAASFRLYLEEQQDGKEYRKDLLQSINSRCTSTIIEDMKSRINTVIIASQLLDASNRREVLNKHYTEVESDYQFFKSSSQQAQAILISLGLPIPQDRITIANLSRGNVSKPLTILQLLRKCFKI